MRYALIALCLLISSLTPARAQLSINFGLPGVNIGIDLGGYPALQRVPGYPVYYAPGVNSNYFFYDGLYWVYDGDNWYASSWYNGPWRLVDRFDVPVYLLRVPVRYYRHAPAYFRGWRADAPPRWGEHWGQSWETRRSGWDQWNRASAPALAPLPTYQRQYTGDRYPQASQQAVIETRNYRYQPRDPVAQQHFQHQRTQAQSAPPQQAAQPQQAAPPQRAQQQQQAPRAREQQAPRSQPQQAEQRQQQAAPPQRAQPQRQQEAARQQRPQEAARQQPQQAEQKPPQERAARGQQGERPQGQEQAHQGKGEDKGRGREKDNKDNKEGKENKER
jgi:hypothetical protein